MTCVVGWRDPFCIVADDAATNNWGLKDSVGPVKMRRLADGLVAGLSGGPQFYDELVDRIGKLLPGATWAGLETLVPQILEDIKGRAGPLAPSVLLIGEYHGGRGILECGPEAPPAWGGSLTGTSLSNPYASIGSGGRVIAVAVALEFPPRAERQGRGAASRCLGSRGRRGHRDGQALLAD